MDVLVLLLIILAIVCGAIGAFTVADWRIRLIAIGVIALGLVHLIGVL